MISQEKKKALMSMGYRQNSPVKEPDKFFWLKPIGSYLLKYDERTNLLGLWFVAAGDGSFQLWTDVEWKTDEDFDEIYCLASYEHDHLFGCQRNWGRKHFGFLPLEQEAEMLLEGSCEECGKNQKFLTSSFCSPCLDKQSCNDSFFDND